MIRLCALALAAAIAAPCLSEAEVLGSDNAVTTLISANCMSPAFDAHTFNLNDQSQNYSLPLNPADITIEAVAANRMRDQFLECRVHAVEKITKVAGDGALPSISSPSGAVPHFTVQKLRDAVGRNDFEAVDTGLAQAQSEFLAGERTADDMRELYIAISRSAPDMVGFVEDWIAKEPENHRAQIARAWSLYNGANFIRLPANPYAYDVSNQMYNELRMLATKAYIANPDLIPASDAMVRGLASAHAETPLPVEVLDVILTKYPNYGTIHRHIPNMYNYSAEIIKGFCNSVAEDFEDAQKPIVEHRCILESATRHNLKDLVEYGRETMWTVTYPEVELNRLAFFVYGLDFREWSDDEIEWATNVLLTHPMDQFQAAYYHNVAIRMGDILNSSFGRTNLLAENYKRARYPEVSEALKYDPYNINLIDLASGVQFRQPSQIITKDDGRTITRSGRFNLSDEEWAAQQLADKAERLEFAKRRVIASPYHAKYWTAYASQIASANHPTSMFDGEKARVNAVIFSNNPAASLQGLVGRKTGQYKLLTEAQALTEEQLAHRPKWRKVLEDTNLATDVLCPALRAKILHEAVCEQLRPDAWQCRPANELWRDHEDRMISAAKKAPECSGILAASSPVDLWYEVVDFGEALGQVGSH